MSIHRRRNAARAPIIAGAVALALSFAAQGQDLTFDIGAGDLKAALDAYAQQTGQQLVYQPDDVKGRSTPGVHGAMTPEQALKALLAGTGLKVSRDPSGAIAIFPAEVATGSASTETAGDDQKLEEVVVTATAISSIYVTSRSATRIDADPMKVPMSISTVQGDLMREQQSRTLSDVLSNVAGVEVGVDNSVTMRGFSASVARNGTVQTGLETGRASLRPTVSVDRVEVVKGPMQILQGSDSGIGGTVNIITKMPEALPSAYLASAVGSDSYWRLDADVNDTLLGEEGNRLMGRLIGSTSGAGETSVGYDGASTDFVSAGLRWAREDWGTDLAVVYEYNDDTQPGWPMVVPQGETLRSGLKEYAFGPKNAYTTMRSDSVDVNLKQRLWQDWSFTVDYIWRGADFKSRAVESYLIAPDTVLSIAKSGPGSKPSSSTDDLKLGLQGQFATGPVRHNLLLAYDYDSGVASIPPGARFSGSYLTDLNTGDVYFDPNAPEFPGGRNSYTETGVLAVDQVNWNAWSGLFGVRWTSADSTYRLTNGLASKSSSDATLPQYGVVYQATSDVSIYASGSEGFDSNDGFRDWKDVPLPNETSTQYETGVKALLFERQVAVTLALYRIQQTNVAAPDEDPDHVPPSGGDPYRTIKGLTTDGVEFEVSGQPIRGLQVRANYTYTQQEDNKGNPPPSGYVPSSFNLWAQYWLGRDSGHGWWGGFGLTAMESSVAPQGGLNTAGFTTFDLQAGYTGQHWNAIAGYKNVADIQTFYPAYAPDLGYPMPGGSFTFDLSYTF